LVGAKGFGQVLVGALAEAPGTIRLLVLGRDDDDSRLLRALVAAQAAEDLVTAALGHDDVEQHDVRPLGGNLVLELLAVDVRDDLVPGGSQDRLHHRDLGVGVVDHHHLAHRERMPPLGARQRPCATGAGCATDLPTPSAARTGLYFKKTAGPTRRKAGKARRGSRSSLGSGDNFAPPPDTLACEIARDACATARTLDLRPPGSLAGILNAPVTYGLDATPEGDDG